MSNEKKLVHLQMLQNTIIRFSNNSFSLKSLCITLIVGIISFYKEPFLGLMILIIDLVFWVLDSYYLSLERYYRAMYNLVCNFEEENIDFFMGVQEEHPKYSLKKESPYKIMFTISMLPYIVIFIITILYLVIVVHNIFLALGFMQGI